MMTKNSENQTFIEQRILFHGTIPYSVTAADLNNGSTFDTIIANFGSSGICIFNIIVLCPYANITGIFFNIGQLRSSVKTNDVNNDDKFDPLIAHFDANNITAFFNDDPGKFPTHTTYPTDLEPHSAPIDGVNGDDTFASQRTVPTDIQPFSVVIVAADDDNHTDILVVHIDIVSLFCLPIVTNTGKLFLLLS